MQISLQIFLVWKKTCWEKQALLDIYLIGLYLESSNLSE